MKLEIIRTGQEFLRLKPQWNKLLNKADVQNFFLTWDWMYTWWEIFRPRLHIVLAYKEDELVAIAPLYEKSGMLRLLADDAVHSSYLDFICAEDVRRELIKTLSEHHLLYLRYVQEDSPLMQAFSGGSIKKMLLSVCPVIAFKDGFDAFMNTLSKSTRKNLRYADNRVSKKLKASITLDKGTCEAKLSEIFRINEQRWKHHPSGAFSDQQKDFLMRLCKRSKHLNVYFLKVNQRSVAYHLGFSFKDTEYLYSASFDPYTDIDDSDKFSFGTCLLFNHLKMAAARGMKEYDLLRGDLDYKMRIATGVKKNLGVFIYRRTLGNELRVSSLYLLNRLSHKAQEMLPQEVEQMLIRYTPKSLLRLIR